MRDCHPTRNTQGKASSYLFQFHSGFTKIGVQPQSLGVVIDGLREVTGIIEPSASYVESLCV